MKATVIYGDILCQKVEAIVNPWNRNILPWWLLMPQGVSGAIKKRGGSQPFNEIFKMGSIPLGEARWTSSGSLPFKGIIHVAGINLLWKPTETSIYQSVQNAIKLALEKKITSLAFPLIGAGVGSNSEEKSLSLMQRAIEDFSEAPRGSISVYVIRFKKTLG